jgi:hypothetical protein
VRVSDAGLRRSKTKLLYPNHRLPPWLTEDATRDRSNRLSNATCTSEFSHYRVNPNQEWTIDDPRQNHCTGTVERVARANRHVKMRFDHEEEPRQEKQRPRKSDYEPYNETKKNEASKPLKRNGARG